MRDLTRRREHWSGRMGVILAVSGSAIGLGNFLRFPGLAAKYEGGAFMIPYFVALLVLGIPLAWAEWSIGRLGGRRGYHSTPGIYWSISRSRLLTLSGGLGVVAPLIIFMYYLLIEGWCLAYTWYYLDGTMAELGQRAREAVPAGALPAKEPYTEFFADLVGTDANGSAFGAQAVFFLLVCFGLNMLCIGQGIARGIERFCVWAMPALFLCAIAILIRVLTLPEISAGLGFMWNLPDDAAGWRRTLLNPTMWLEAAGQVLFSLSVGFGIIVTYASYVRSREDIALSSLTAISANEFCEVALAGLMIIPAAFLLLGAAQVTDASGSVFNLGFQTLPLVFEVMPMGRLIGLLFFFLLFLAAITSSISMIQGTVALFEEGLNLSRRTSVGLLSGIAFTGTMFTLYFSRDTIAMGTLDSWVGTLFIYALATIQTLVFGWVLGVNRGLAELGRGAAMRVPRFVGWMIRYVCPVYLGVLFVGFLYDQLLVKEQGMLQQLFTDRDALLTVLFMLAVVGLFVLFIACSIPRWRQREQAQKELEP